MASPKPARSCRWLARDDRAADDRQRAGRWVATSASPDTAAAPALFYGNRVEPFGEAHGSMRAYLERLEARPSFALVLKTPGAGDRDVSKES